LSCGRLVDFAVDAIRGHGQVIDIGTGGCKLLPEDLGPLIEHDIDRGAEIVLSFGAMSMAAVLVWATPNRSALGCRFRTPLCESTVGNIRREAL
jgi:hypothetical protein